MTIIRAQMVFDDEGSTILPTDAGFKLQDNDGNAITLSLSALLRCMAIAEYEKQVPPLPGEFWQTVEAKIKAT